MDIELFKHNELAYQKLEEALLKHQMVTIDHATGTGKSFIALKYLYKNRDKKILYLTPTYPIFTQLIKTHSEKLGININDFGVFDNIIYRNLLGMNMNEIARKYDIIILDEYHRCGAKEWGKKITSLLSILEKEYSEKKVVGLTATPIRYLNDERNMNNELFNGVCASTLELSDAILQSILPAPIYVNTMLSCSSRIDKLRSLIEKKIFYSEDRNKYLSILNELEEYIASNSNPSDIFSPYIKGENGKYIVFNSNINAISKNKKKIGEWFKGFKINSYEIHSRQSNIKNEEILEDFRNSSDGINMLFVVDILNEGIHVDGIDGIMMMRHTTSPIIYFQQLGRLLSYSGREDELVVWDLAGNLKSHKVIYYLYQDVKERAKQLILDDPLNAQRYETILNRFRIIDMTVDVINRIDKVEDFLTEEKIINMRLNSAIRILNSDSDYDQNERIQAHIDLFKYLNFIDEKMFKKIENLNIIKPAELDVSYETFCKDMKGFKNLHEKSEAYNNNIFRIFEEFVLRHGRVPSVLNNDVYEISLAQMVVFNSDRFSGKLRKKLIELVVADRSISAYDRVYYGKSIPESKYKEFFNTLEKIYNNDVMLSENIIKFLKNVKCSDEYDVVYYLDRIYEQSKRSVKKNKSSNLTRRMLEFIKATGGELPSYKTSDENERRLFLEFNSQSDAFKNKYIKIAKSSKLGLYGLETDDEKKLATEKFVDELLRFINIWYRYPTQGIPEESKMYSKYMAYNGLLIQFGFKEKLDELVKLKKVEKIENDKKIFIVDLLVFIKNNYGDLPSNKVSDVGEQKLAKLYFKFKKYFTEEDRFVISKEINKVKEEMGSDVLELYINFILKNKRYPLEDSDDVQEVELVKRYKRNEESFTQIDRERIIRIFGQVNKKEAFKNTYAEILKNRRK